MKKALIILVGFTALIFFAAVFVRAQEEPSDSSATSLVVEEVAADSTPIAEEGKAGLISKKVQDASSIKLSNVLRGLLGLLVLIGIAWAFSRNRKGINWKVVGTGLVVQI